MTSLISAAILGLSPIQHIQSEVQQTIEHSEKVPGIAQDVFTKIKENPMGKWPNLEGCWNALVQKGALEHQGPDAEVRPYFVSIQTIVEHVLANELGKNVKSLTGIIHTPMPATPLCAKGTVSKEAGNAEGLVTPAIAEDPARLFTVNARTTIVRDYLSKGGDLYIVYPKEGKNLRKPAEIAIYEEELNNNKEHLFDRPLDCEALDQDISGATYLFKTTEDKTYAFAIKFIQANCAPGEEVKVDAGLWFGEVTPGSEVEKRVSRVVDYVKTTSAYRI
jgi:hypothetical protein